MVKHQEKCDILLIALRKIIRSIDLHSKQLVNKYGLTGPQMIVLKVICQSGMQLLNSTQLAREVSLSQATITSILDRLLEKGYIRREKSEVDKRKTYIKPTDKATAVFEQNPTLLQEDFIKQFDALKDWEQDLMIASLGRMADMMHAESIDAAPVLANTDILVPQSFNEA